MNRFLWLTFSFLLVSSLLFSQKHTEEYHISLPEQKIRGSLYNKIEFVDSRYDKTSMGIVQLGAFNKKARVITSIPFKEQLTKVVEALTDTSAMNGELLFQLRQFSFAELTGAMSEKGYCYLRAVLYAKLNDNYQTLGTIDTVILVKSLDVTKALFRNGSKTITNFISSSLAKSPVNATLYSVNDVLNIDGLEKRKISLYNVREYVDGLYTTWNSFMKQVPDKTVTAELKDESISSVRTLNEKGKHTKVKAKEVYAVVYKGRPFIATEYGYYLIRRTDDDYYFTGKARISADAGDVMAASFFFGIIGGLMASSANATFEMKIDHLNGGFIRIREVTNADSY